MNSDRPNLIRSSCSRTARPSTPTLGRRAVRRNRGLDVRRNALWLLAFLVGAPTIALAANERIDGEIVVHGRRVEVERLHEAVAAHDAAAATARRWRSDGSPVVETRSGAWWIVSRHHGDRIETEQWREQPGGRAEGVRSISRREPAAQPWTALPPASRLGLAPVAESDSITAGRSVRTAVYLSREAPERMHARWLGVLPAAGFNAPTMPGPLSPAIGGADRTTAARAGSFAGQHRSFAEEIVWTVAPHRDGAALVVHRSRIEPRRAPGADGPGSGSFLSMEGSR